MRYEFIVTGSVPDDVAADLPEMALSSHLSRGTSVYGPVLDESDVSTLLARILHHGLSVVDVRPLPD
jgi:hypothetical protein